MKVNGERQAESIPESTWWSFHIRLLLYSARLILHYVGMGGLEGLIFLLPKKVILVNLCDGVFETL